MRKLAISLFVLLPLCALLSAQDKEKGKGGGRGPQNLKVLKINSPQEIGPIMRTFTTGLGVQCTFCHVQGDFASDENPKKNIARGMITMAEHINANFPDGKVHVTCFTCHRGETQPKTAAAPQ